MTIEQNWYVAEAIFEATVHIERATEKLVSETLLFLVRAVDHSSAVTKAENIAREKEHSYQNEMGQQVSWTFVRLVEVTRTVDQQFEEGAELKSTMTELQSQQISPRRE